MVEELFATLFYWLTVISIICLLILIAIVGVVIYNFIINRKRMEQIMKTINKPVNICVEDVNKVNGLHRYIVSTSTEEQVIDEIYAFEFKKAELQRHQVMTDKHVAVMRR